MPVPPEGGQQLWGGRLLTPCAAGRRLTSAPGVIVIRAASAALACHAAAVGTPLTAVISMAIVASAGACGRRRHRRRRRFDAGKDVLPLVADAHGVGAEVVGGHQRGRPLHDGHLPPATGGQAERERQADGPPTHNDSRRGGYAEGHLGGIHDAEGRGGRRTGAGRGEHVESESGG